MANNPNDDLCVGCGHARSEHSGIYHGIQIICMHVVNGSKCLCWFREQERRQRQDGGSDNQD